MPISKLSTTKIKTSSRIIAKVDVMFLLLTIGVICGSFFLSVIIINSAILARH